MSEYVHVVDLVLENNERVEVVKCIVRIELDRIDLTRKAMYSTFYCTDFKLGMVF